MSQGLGLRDWISVALIDLAGFLFRLSVNQSYGLLQTFRNVLLSVFKTWNLFRKQMKKQESRPQSTFHNVQSVLPLSYQVLTLGLPKKFFLRRS